MATNDLLSRYKKQKKAEAEKDITHNNSTSDSPFTLSKYREMKKNNQVNYDTQIVTDWFNNADKYMTSVSENTSTQPAYNWINENSQFYADNFSDLLSQSDYVRTYINSLKGTEQYDSLQKQFDSYNDNIKNYKDYLSGLKDFASKFADEEHYNNAVNNIDNSETELEKGSKYAAYASGGKSFDDKKISDFLTNPDSISNPKDFASGLQNLDNGNGTLKYWETQDRLRDVKNVDTVPTKDQFAQYKKDSDMLFNQDMEEKYGVSDYDYDKLVKAYNSTDDYREKEWLKDKFHSVATSEQLQQEYDKLIDEYNSLLKSSEENHTTSERKTITDRLDFIEKRRPKLQNLIQRKIQEENEEKYYYDIVENDVKAATVIQKYYELNEFNKNGKSYKSANADEAVKYPEMGEKSQDERTKIEQDFYNLEEKGYDTEKLLKYYSRIKEREEAEEELEYLRNQADKYPISSSFGSMVMNTYGSIPDTVNYIGAGIDKAFGGDGYINPDSTNVAKAQVMREKVSEDMDGFGKFFYNTGMSIGDNIARMPLLALPGGKAMSLALAGTSAGVSSANDVINSGGSIENALLTGTAAGAAEVIFEKIPLDKLIKLKNEGTEAVWKAVAEQMAIEGVEEGLTDITNAITDQIINGDMSQLSQQYQKYIKLGYNEDEAWKMCAVDFGTQVGQSFAAGAISGGVLGGGAIGINYATNKAEGSVVNKQVGKAVKENENVNSLIETAKKLSPESKAHKVAVQLEEQQKNNKKVSSSKVGKLRSLIIEQSQSEFNAEYKKVTENLHEDEKAVVDKLLNREALSEDEVKILNDNDVLKNSIADVQKKFNNLYSSTETANKAPFKSIKSIDDNTDKIDETKLKVSENGKTKVNDEIYDGAMEVVRTNPFAETVTYKMEKNGEVIEVNSENIEFRTKEEAKLNALASKYNVQTAQKFFDLYESGQDVDEYSREFNIYQNYGRLAVPLTDDKMNTGFNLNPDQKMGAYEAGLTSRKSYYQEQNIISSNARNSKYYAYTKGKFNASAIKGIQLDETQRAFYNFFREFALRTGINVELFSSKEKSGKYQGEQGSWDKNTKTIRVDINAGLMSVNDRGEIKHGMLNTFSHELTHIAESSGFYDELHEAIVSALEKRGTDFNELVKAKKDEMLRTDPKAKTMSDEKLTYLADVEVIANNCETMLKNSKIFEDIAQGNPTLAQKIKDKLKNFIARLKQLLNKTNALTHEGKLLEECVTEFEEIQKLWDKAVTDGIKTANAMHAEQKNNTAENSDVKNSSRYSYNELINKPDMKITVIDDSTEYTPNAATRKKIIDEAVENAINVGYKNANKNAVVKVEDIKTDVIISKNALRHGLDRRLNILAPITLNVGDILRNSIRINEMLPKNPNAEKVYVLIGAAKNQHDNPYIVSFVVNRLTNEITSIDVLYSVNVKKEEAAGFNNPSVPPINEDCFTASEISISDLLDYVNKYYPDILSEDVLKHYNYDSRPDGKLGESVLYQSRTADIDNEYLEAVKNNNLIEAQELVDEYAISKGFLYRRCTPNYLVPHNKVPWMMFVKAEDNYSLHQFGDYNFVAHDREAIDVDDIKDEIQKLALEYLGAELEDEVINPPDIVESAGMFDDEDFVQFLWDNYFEKIYEESGEIPAVKTEDGLIVFYDDFNRIKSADPITYDDDGNVIPLSKRFINYSVDIRYQSRNTGIDEDIEELLFDEEFYKPFENEDKTVITESLSELQTKLENMNDDNSTWEEQFSTRIKIKALKEGYKSPYDYFVGKQKKNILKDYEYDPEKYKEKFKKKLEKKAKEESLKNDIANATPHKRAQYYIIQKTNPMWDDYHLGIRSPKDIKTFQEVVDEGEGFEWGDFDLNDAKKALKKGTIRVYSSYAIKNGTFVSTSYQQALQYAGMNPQNVHSRVVALDSVAWINGDEGQYAKVYKSDLDDNIQYQKRYVEPASTALEERLQGDELLDAQDIIDTIKSVGGKVDEYGNAILYHGTNKKSRDSIYQSGKMTAKEDGLFFSTKPDGEIKGYGDNIVRVKIPVEYLELNDVFNDEAHFRLPLNSDYSANVSSVLFQMRPDNGFANRRLLANALEKSAQNNYEKNKVKLYKENIDQIDELEARLDDVNEKIKKATSVKAAERTREQRTELMKLNNIKKTLQDKIVRKDKQLLNFESMDVMKKLIESEKKKARHEARINYEAKLKEKNEKHNAELASVKERDRERLADVIESKDKIIVAEREKRKTMVKGIREARDKKEIIRKTIKKIKDIDKLLNRSKADKTVKQELRDTASKLLSLKDILLDTNLSNADIVRRGVETATPEEQKLLDEYLSIIGDTDTELTEAQRRKVYQLNSKLKDLFIRERERLNRATVKQALTELSETYKSVENAPEAYLRNSFDKNIIEAIDNFKEEIGGTLVKDMNVEQVQKLHDIVTMILTSIRNANKHFAENIKTTCEETSSDVMNEILNVKGTKEIRNFIASKILDFQWRNLKPIYAFRLMGSKTFEKIYWNLQKGELDWYIDLAEAKQFKEECEEKYGYKSFDFKKMFEFTAMDGSTFTLDLNQMMDIYAASRRPQALQHLLKGGFTFEKDSADGKLKIKTGAKAYPLTMGTIQSIANGLSENEKGYAEEMQKYLSEVMATKGNEVSMALYGVEMFNEDTYWSISSSDTFLKVEENETTGEFKVKNSGFTKSTIRNASNPIVLRGFEENWCNHVNQMSLYHALTLPLEDFTKVFNYNTGVRTSEENPTAVTGVRSVIKGAFGNAAEHYFRQFMRDLNGGIREASRVGIADNMIALSKKAAVFANLSVVLQQPSTVFRAMAYVNAKFFLPEPNKLVRLQNHRKDWEQLKKYAPIAGIKEMGMFDTGTGKGVLEWLSSGKRDSIVKKTQNKIDGVGSWLPAKADEYAWIKLWHAIQRETRAKYGLAIGTEENLVKSGERFNEVVHLTQVYDSVFSRSGAMRSSQTFDKMATSFMAEPTTIMNMAVDAVVQLKRNGKSGIKQFAKSASAILISILANTLLKSIVTAGRDDDEDETYRDKYLQAFCTDLINSAIPLNYYPIMRDLVSVIEGYTTERMDMSLVSDFVVSLKKLLKEDGATANNIIDFVGYIANLFGLPVRNVVRDFRAVFNTYNTLTTASKNSITSLEMSIPTDYQEAYDKYWKEGYTEEDCESKAVTSVKSKIRKKLRPAYLEALKNQDSATVANIRRYMRDSGFYKSLNDVDEVLKGWRKSSDEEEERAQRAEERK